MVADITSASGDVTTSVQRIRGVMQHLDSVIGETAHRTDSLHHSIRELSEEQA
ncbi:hypothetical protein [Marispirochaeta sp.]|uniref:hypothetical protein n=1 Tax=Marispirochaeta sp. TaxID=2038653 RepID=UPI0029C82A5F|nr:hypothetical protein [Marispirochaeta sp.]